VALAAGYNDISKKGGRLNSVKLQIVIPLLNLWDTYTAPCLASIRASFDHRVVVIDNGSTDETSEMAQRRVSASFIYHRNPCNLGVARVWNDGIRDAFANGYDVVLVLNNDILLHPECIDRLVSRIAADESLGMVTAVNVRGNCANTSDMFAIDARARETIADAESPDFAAFLLNRKAWETVGPFDEGFSPAYFEDNDYHYRMRLLGLRAIAHPPAVFYHFGSRTQNQAIGQPVVRSEKFEENRDRYIRKWGGLPGQERFTAPFDGD
jgi:GT2 family glycosyltransferase